MANIAMNGLCGSNPLGFLAALGAFRILADTIPEPVRMSWCLTAAGWMPTLSWNDSDEGWSDQWLIAGIIACRLGAPARRAPENRLRELAVSDESYRSRRKCLVEHEKSLKEKGRAAGLKGADLSQFIRVGSESMRIEVALLRRNWLVALERLALSPELSLGKTLAVTVAELKEHANRISAECSSGKRLVADLLAAFGAEGRSEDEYIKATEFCFVNGSGQQFFLETVQKLLYVVTPERIQRTLFEPWDYSDLRFSMRWDPVDDRRYALMWSNPIAAGNEARTMWAANLLAYYGLSFFPCFASDASVMTTGFGPKSRKFTWPLWTSPITVDVVRSILASEYLVDRPIKRDRLRLLGIADTYEAERLQVGTPPLVKLNFGQPHQA